MSYQIVTNLSKPPDHVFRSMKHRALRDAIANTPVGDSIAIPLRRTELGEEGVDSQYTRLTSAAQGAVNAMNEDGNPARAISVNLQRINGETEDDGRDRFTPPLNVGDAVLWVTIKRPEPRQ